MKVLKIEVIMKKMEKNKQFDNLFKVNGVKTEVKIDFKISTSRKVHGFGGVIKNRGNKIQKRKNIREY